ncbi:MAG: hypothetical protein IJK97_01670, partial [Thermoguttaceae bacterium]|nr:hypothetical protein [Thermoguttaceae bacterium]
MPYTIGGDIPINALVGEKMTCFVTQTRRQNNFGARPGDHVPGTKEKIRLRPNGTAGLLGSSS